MYVIICLSPIFDLVLLEIGLDISQDSRYTHVRLFLAIGNGACCVPWWIASAVDHVEE